MKFITLFLTTLLAFTPAARADVVVQDFTKRINILLASAYTVFDDEDMEKAIVYTGDISEIQKLWSDLGRGKSCDIEHIAGDNRDEILQIFVSCNLNGKEVLRLDIFGEILEAYEPFKGDEREPFCGARDYKPDDSGMFTQLCSFPEHGSYRVDLSIFLDK